MSITRREARMIAEELYKLQQQERQQRRLTAREAADMLGWSVKTLYNNAHLLSDTRNRRPGQRLSFSLANIEAYKQKQLEG